jgi:hypothetical protein
MHLLVTWQVRTISKQATLETALEGAIKPYSWVKPMSNAYVVHVTTTAEYDSVTSALIDVARSNQDDIWIVITPPMNGGRYTGWLPRNYWDEVNSRAL